MNFHSSSGSLARSIALCRRHKGEAAMFFDEAIRRVKMLFRGKQFQDDLDEEMRLHREFREKKYVDSGMSPEAARSAAHRSFGSAASIRETSYRAWGWSWLESLTQDVRYGVRSMFRSPALTWWRCSRSLWASARTPPSSAFSMQSCFVRFRSKSQCDLSFSAKETSRASPTGSLDHAVF